MAATSYVHLIGGLNLQLFKTCKTFCYFTSLHLIKFDPQKKQKHASHMSHEVGKRWTMQSSDHLAPFFLGPLPSCTAKNSCFTHLVWRAVTRPLPPVFSSFFFLVGTYSFTYPATMCSFFSCLELVFLFRFYMILPLS